MTYTISSSTQKLQSICPVKPQRRGYAMAYDGVHYNSTHAVATDGLILAIAPKVPGEPDNVTLKFDSPKLKSKAHEAVEYQHDVITGKLCNGFGDTAEIIDQPFINWEQVIPNEINNPDDWVCVSLDAALLKRLADVISASDTKKTARAVTLLIHKTERTPILAMGEIPGMIMPMISIPGPLSNDPDPKTKIINTFSALKTA